MSDETIRVTDGHPFYVTANDDKWVQAEDLVIGDVIKSSEGDSVSIANITSEVSDEAVYNLTVANTHNYYVGEEKLLAHNSTCRIPHRARPRLENGNKKEGWEHIVLRHMPGGAPRNMQGDLFAPGTTRDQIKWAAEKLIASGKRNTDPNLPIQTFVKRMVINGKRANYKIVVDSDDGNRIITMFPDR
jgi:hypothetical protein